MTQLMSAFNVKTCTCPHCKLVELGQNTDKILCSSNKKVLKKSSSMSNDKYNTEKSDSTANTPTSLVEGGCINGVEDVFSDSSQPYHVFKGSASAAYNSGGINSGTNGENNENTFPAKRKYFYKILFL